MTFSSRERIVAGVSLAAAVLSAGCSDNYLNVTNPNSIPIAAAGSDPNALAQQATGLMVDWRGTRAGYITSTGIFGREAYNFTLSEPRNTTAYLIGIGAGQNKLDPGGFANGIWGGEYSGLRDIFNFKLAVAAASTTLVPATQKQAAIGFAETMEAALLLHVIATRDTLGAVVQTNPDPADLAPFVSRDSAYRYILATLADASAQLNAGATAFPFALHSGFKTGATDFTKPATFAKLTNGLLARAAAYYATEGGSAASWQTALTALQASFINTTASGLTRAGLDDGVYQVYSASTGDSQNGLNFVNNTNLYAHMSIQTDVQKKADGTNDNRYTAKIRTAPFRVAPGGAAAASSLGFSIWSAATSPIAEMRNEELILLRSEAKLATGDKAGAIADLELVRSSSGGLPPTGLTAATAAGDILTALLYEKRMSLLMEGHRWIDMRRYGRLGQLPIDITSGPQQNFVAVVMPVPQAECLLRAGKAAPYAGPGC